MLFNVTVTSGFTEDPVYLCAAILLITAFARLLDETVVFPFP